MITEAFNFGRIPDIYFGVRKRAVLPHLLKEYGQRVLLVTGSQSLEQSPHWAELQRQLALHQFEVHHIRISGEPTPTSINHWTTALAGKAWDSVLAIGGGSVLDTGKSLAAMLPTGEPVERYLEEFGEAQHSGKTLPFVAMPTTAATGSEVTRYAILSEVGLRGEKKRLSHSYFVPKISIVDPELTQTLPLTSTVYGAFNAFAQLLESYVSPASNQLIDTLAFKGITYVIKSLPQILKRPDRLSARTSLAYAAMVSGVTSSNAGLGAASGLALGTAGQYDVPYSVLSAMFLAPTHALTIRLLQAQMPDHPALEKYARIGELLHKGRGRSRSYYLKQFIEGIHHWADSCNIPKLGAYGLSANAFGDILAHSSAGNHPWPLDENDLLDILQSSC